MCVLRWSFCAYRQLGYFSHSLSLSLPLSLSVASLSLSLSLSLPPPPPLSLSHTHTFTLSCFSASTQLQEECSLSLKQATCRYARKQVSDLWVECICFGTNHMKWQHMDCLLFTMADPLGQQSFLERWEDELAEHVSWLFIFCSNSCFWLCSHCFTTCWLLILLVSNCQCSQCACSFLESHSFTFHRQDGRTDSWMRRKITAQPRRGTGFVAQWSVRLVIGRTVPRWGCAVFCFFFFRLTQLRVLLSQTWENLIRNDPDRSEFGMFISLLGNLSEI